MLDIYRHIFRLVQMMMIVQFYWLVAHIHNIEVDVEFWDNNLKNLKAKY